MTMPTTTASTEYTRDVLFNAHQQEILSKIAVELGPS